MSILRFWCPGKFFSHPFPSAYPHPPSGFCHVKKRCLSSPSVLHKMRKGFGELASSFPQHWLPQKFLGSRSANMFLTWHFSEMLLSPHAQACCVAFGRPSTGCSILCSMTVGWYQTRCFREVDPAMPGEGSQTQAWATAAGALIAILAYSQTPAPTPSCYRVV